MSVYRNGEQFVRHIAVLRRQLSEEREYTSEERRSLLGDLEFLSLGIGRAFSAVHRLAELQASTGNAAYDLQPGIGILVLSPDQREPMAFEVDSFLDGARRSQDGLVSCIRRVLSISLPKSAAQLMKGVRANKFNLPKPILALLNEYWSCHGHMLKHYRDATQHHMIVASDARLYRSESGEPLIHLLLPNNPEEKSATRFDFENPEVHAFEYVSREFLALLKVTYKITGYLVSLGSNTNEASLSFAFRNPVTFRSHGGKRFQLDMVGHPIPSPDDFVREVENVVSTLDGAR